MVLFHWWRLFHHLIRDKDKILTPVCVARWAGGPVSPLVMWYRLHKGRGVRRSLDFVILWG